MSTPSVNSSGRLRPLKPRRAIRVLEKLGFKLVRQTASRLVFKRNDGRMTVVPVHYGEDIGRGLLRKIAWDVGLTPAEFMRVVDEDC